MPALENIDLEIEDKEFFCLVGPSGSGKSTILKIIAGIESPTSGEINGSRKAGMVFQLGALFPWLTVKENILFGIKMGTNATSESKESIGELLRLVNLEGYQEKYPRQLSGGQRQRVGIARALAINPQLLLLDEPFSALDSATTNILHQDLLNIWEKTGKTIIMVSHSIEEAVLLADRICVISSGKLVKIINIELIRPRDTGSQEYLNKVKEIENLINL